MGRQVNEREIVLAVLMEITENGAYSHKILGDLTIEYIPKTNHVFMTGPATEVFSGEIDIM